MTGDGEQGSLFDDDDDDGPPEEPPEEMLEGDFEREPMAGFVERAYLEYSMYVLKDRALPHVEDGLKPVQRRIIYSMRELGLTPTAKPRKSARVVGDVLGKYHPHGDQACYDAMVLMAQSFSTRYPLVHGQGNWGSLTDRAAAMRYTEARLTPFAQDILLDEIKQGTVDPVANFDGTMTEPRLLPAKLPVVLLNGTTGIAVGMSTDIPPHNIGEVAAALIRLLEKPKTTVAELFLEDIFLGPDFPVAAEIITPPEQLQEIYETGNGTLRSRAAYRIEGGEVVIDALPYQVSAEKVIEQIAGQLVAKKLPMLDDVRDEGDYKTDTRIVLVPKRRRPSVTEEELHQVMRHLFATTDLERSHRCNLTMIGLDGKPATKDLITVLQEWLSYRRETVRRRLMHRLGEIVRRLERIAALLIAHLNIDRVIQIVRFEPDPKASLIEEFDLTDNQAEAILETKLRHLNNLEQEKLEAEEAALEKEKADIEALLGSERRLTTLLKKEIKKAAKDHASDRISPIVTREAASAMDETELIAKEDVMVILSTSGFVRAGKGHTLDPEGLTYKSGDGYLDHAIGVNTQSVAFVDSGGRIYSTPAHTLPSARSTGDPLGARFDLPPGASFQAVLMGADDSIWLMASDAGYGFVAQFSDLLSRAKKGKQVLTVPKGAVPLRPAPILDPDNDLLVCGNSAGYLLAFPVAELPALARGKGNKMIGIPGPKFTKGEERMVGVVVVQPGQTLRVTCGRRDRVFPWADIETLKGDRGRRGTKLPKGYRNVDALSVE